MIWNGCSSTTSVMVTICGGLQNKIAQQKEERSANRKINIDGIRYLSISIVERQNNKSFELKSIGNRFTKKVFTRSNINAGSTAIEQQDRVHNNHSKMKCR